MAMLLHDLDLTLPTPSELPLQGHDAVWLIGWINGIPVGTSVLRPEPGTHTISGTALDQAAHALRGDTPSPSVPTTALPSVSVVICTRDRPELLPIVLQALGEQTHRDFELVIVENAPRDERTRRVVERYAPDARYVIEPVPGLPRARNTGIMAASGDVIAFTDDDCRPGPRWAETIARAFAADPALGCVTGPILPLELATPAQEAMEARGGFNRGFRRVRHEPHDETDPVYPVQAWKFGAGGSMALSRGCLDELGGFDVALSRSEDLDIFYRTLRAGFALAFEPGAVVRHRHLPQWRQLARRMVHWGWGYLTFLDKIVRTDVPPYTDRARLERRNWLRWQLRHRALPALRGRADLPLPLVLLEIGGGVRGLHGYPLARASSVDRTTPPPNTG